MPEGNLENPHVGIRWCSDCHSGHLYDTSKIVWGQHSLRVPSVALLLLVAREKKMQRQASNLVLGALQLNLPMFLTETPDTA
jgi:hypothetical protein